MHWDDPLIFFRDYESQARSHITITHVDEKRISGVIGKNDYDEITFAIATGNTITWASMQTSDDDDDDDGESERLKETLLSKMIR